MIPMVMRKVGLLAMLVGLLLSSGLNSGIQAQTAALSNGLLPAMPVAHGPKINGSLRGWNMAAADPIWMSAATAKNMHALAVLEYTKRALYFGVRVTLPNRKLINVNSPMDAFWRGDEVELRLVADPSVAYPVNPLAANVKNNLRAGSLTFWKDSVTGQCYIQMFRGVNLNLGHVVNPPGSAIKVVEHGKHGYTMTARIPWSVLDAPGGVLPFKPGQKMAAVISVHFAGLTYIANAVYRKDPGSFAFNRSMDWGQVAFAKTDRIAPLYPPLNKYLAQHAAQARGAPITVQVPRREKVSINIFGPHGQVIRELMTGAVHKKGPLTVYWNGRDQWGSPVPLGTYQWGAYFSPGLRAKYIGTVGSSGAPPYPTPNGLGGWGGDHGPCIDVAADKTGMYFLWTVAEAQKAVVKVNYHYQTVWRTTPFVGGGFGPLYAMACNGRRVFIVFGGANPSLVKLSAKTGQMLIWPNGSPTVPISHAAMVKVPPQSSPLSFQPEGCGLAANAHQVFASVYSKNQIRIFNPHTGQLTGSLACAGPRGVCLDSKGNLFAVSYVPGQPGKIVEFVHAAGASREVVADHLAMPWHVAVDSQGNIHVTDEGASQQVKVFSPQGRLIQTLGKRGGRPWAGKYEATNYLEPAGIVADAQGGILTAQASLPKVFSRNDAATGKLLKQWFGSQGYWGQLVPSPLHPRTVYYQLEPAGLARARVLSRHKVAAPQAYWLMPKAGYHSVGQLNDGDGQPDTVRAVNHQSYYFGDFNPHGIALIQGNQMLPVAHFLVLNKGEKGNPYPRNVLEIWSDRNGDHHIEPGEVQRVTSIAGKPLVPLAQQEGSMWMARNGDIYLATEANSILEIPAVRFRANGSIKWDPEKARYAVPCVLKRAGKHLWTGWREGILGMRVDKDGNIYVCVNATVRYDTTAETKAMNHGMGHDSCCNAVKFMKFSPAGKLLWMAGRKAADQSGHGLLHHFWVMGGLVGDSYVAGGSEWGQIYFYTHDGFFVSSIMNNPNQAPLPGPYTFGSETDSGFVRYFPAKNQVWAYAGGMAYKVLGFDHGKVTGQSRQWGQVVLPAIYPSKWQRLEKRRIGHLVIAPLHKPWNNPAAWPGVPVSALRRGGRLLAKVQLGYNAQYLCARFAVVDAKPIANAAHSAKIAFHGGDTVGLDLGPASAKGARLVRGDVRILAALINGKPELIGMKPISQRYHAKASYYTPSGGHVHFAFVGYIPGGKVNIVRDANGKGYVATLAVPRKFLALSLKTGATLRMDVEVNYSGYTDRGLQVLSRNYLFSPNNGTTTMIDDIPTEAKLNPQWWGQATVK
ncbi:MAG: hypothetical protein HKL95_06170 [Phycisphaerae bacterium]|nr:hypothetical protein [Phycisphaerae bacterium]